MALPLCVPHMIVHERAELFPDSKKNRPEGQCPSTALKSVGRLLAEKAADIWWKEIAGIFADGVVRRPGTFDWIVH